MPKIGRAYGFFNCNAEKEKVENEFSTVRELVRTPREMELYFSEDMDSLKNENDIDLTPIIEKAKEAGMRYVLKAEYPRATNRKTADNLAAILNQLYNTPLYSEGENFNGEIVYKKGCAYVFRD